MLWVKDLTGFVEMPATTEDFGSRSAFWKINFKNGTFFFLFLRVLSLLAAALLLLKL